MPFVFKNPDFGKWVYQFFDEPSVQKQIEQQWSDGLGGIGLSIGGGKYLCKTRDEFYGIRGLLTFSKKELVHLPEYRPDQWNLYPQVLPPVAGSYLVSVRSDEGTIETRVDQYFSDDDSWVWNEPHEILAFKAVPAPYNPKEGETK